MNESRSKLDRSIGEPLRGQTRAKDAGIIELVRYAGELPALRLAKRPEND